jgi:ubiquinone/menaquinone biosynthesis C-methylase UbiE
MSMDSKTSGSSPGDSGWNRYWLGMLRGGSFGVGGANHPLFDSFWRDFFSSLQTGPDPTAIIDVASGDGAVLAAAIEMLGPKSVEATCLDISQHAVALLQRRMPHVHGLVANALRIPLASGSFEVVTSQFGVEYAGIGAFEEVARLLAPGGRMACLIHHRSGSIFGEAQKSLDAVAGLENSRFIPLAIAMFEAGFASSQGYDRQGYDSAAQNLLPAYRQLEELLKTYGSHVAGGTLLRLYTDVEKIHQQMEQYDQAEVLQWLASLETGLVDFASTMMSMRDAALDEPKFLAVCAALENAGLELQQAMPLCADDSERPIAWALTAEMSIKENSRA